MGWSSIEINWKTVRKRESIKLWQSCFRKFKSLDNLLLIAITITCTIHRFTCTTNNVWMFSHVNAMKYGLGALSETEYSMGNICKTYMRQNQFCERQYQTINPLPARFLAWHYFVNSIHLFLISATLQQMPLVMLNTTTCGRPWQR